MEDSAPALSSNPVSFSLLTSSISPSLRGVRAAREPIRFLLPLTGSPVPRPVIDWGTNTEDYVKLESFGFGGEGVAAALWPPLLCIRWCHLHIKAPHFKGIGHTVISEGHWLRK